MPLSGKASIPMMPFSDWKNYLDAGWQIISDALRQADPKIDEIAGPQLQRHAFCDEFLIIHERDPFRLSIMWSTSTCGVITSSGGITPVGTISAGSTITVVAAVAMIGLKLRAVSA